jgi:hypothetical protein
MELEQELNRLAGGYGWDGQAGGHELSFKEDVIII